MTLKKKIEILAKNIGFNERSKTIIRLQNGENPDEKILKLESGSFDSNKPWFIVDENENVYPMFNADSITKIYKGFKNVVEDSFNAKLERAILEQLPLDFQDVWTVVMNEIQKLPNKKKLLNLNVEGIVKNIKKNHPNLFYQLDLKDIVIEESFDDRF